MVRLANYEITRDLDGAIKLLRQANTIDLTSPRDRITVDPKGRVCPLGYVAKMFDMWDQTPQLGYDVQTDFDKIIRLSRILFGEGDYRNPLGYVVHLYDDSRSKKDGLAKVLKYLNLYKKDREAALADAQGWASATERDAVLTMPF